MLTNEQRLMVEENMRLIPFVINKLRFSITRARLNFDDARQAGYEGLCMAAERWNPERAKLSTYAVLYIRGQILKACAENNPVGVGRGAISGHPELWTAAISLQTPLGQDGDSLTLEDLLPAANDTQARSAVADMWEMFSAKEQRILSGLLDGRKQVEIAQATRVSRQTVYMAMKRIRRKTTNYLAACEA